MVSILEDASIANMDELHLPFYLAVYYTSQYCPELILAKTNIKDTTCLNVIFIVGLVVNYDLH